MNGPIDTKIWKGEKFNLDIEHMTCVFDSHKEKIHCISNRDLGNDQKHIIDDVKDIIKVLMLVMKIFKVFIFF